MKAWRAASCATACSAGGSWPKASAALPATMRPIISGDAFKPCSHASLSNEAAVRMASTAPSAPTASTMPTKRVVVLMPEPMPVRSRGMQARMAFCVVPFSKPAPAPVTTMPAATRPYDRLPAARAVATLPTATISKPVTSMPRSSRWRMARGASLDSTTMATANGSMAQPASTAEKPKPFCRYSGKNVIITCAAMA